MTDTTMTDLYLNGSLLTVRLSARARERYDQALWYCWGRQDAGDDRTRGQRYSDHHLGDDFGFAEYAALEAERFERQQTCMLDNIGSQYGRFVGES